MTSTEGRGGREGREGREGSGDRGDREGSGDRGERERGDRGDRERDERGESIGAEPDSRDARDVRDTEERRPSRVVRWVFGRPRLVVPLVVPLVPAIGKPRTEDFAGGALRKGEKENPPACETGPAWACFGLLRADGTGSNALSSLSRAGHGVMGGLFFKNRCVGKKPLFRMWLVVT